MGQITDKKYKDAKALAKSVRGVQTKLNQSILKEIDDKYNADIAKAKKNRNEENAYVKRRDQHLLDRKIWHDGDQISLYDITYCDNKYKYAVYFEQNKKGNPREEQFEHMGNFEFKTLEQAKAVFDAMSDGIPMIFSPCTEDHILGKSYKVVPV